MVVVSESGVPVAVVPPEGVVAVPVDSETEVVSVISPVGPVMCVDECACVGVVSAPVESVLESPHWDTHSSPSTHRPVSGSKCSVGRQDTWTLSSGNPCSIQT